LREVARKAIVIPMLLLGSFLVLRMTGLTTVAAIDRLMHHSVIIKLTVPSFRVETAYKSKSTGQQPATTSSTIPTLNPDSSRIFQCIISGAGMTPPNFTSGE